MSLSLHPFHKDRHIMSPSTWVHLANKICMKCTVKFITSKRSVPVSNPYPERLFSGPPRPESSVSSRIRVRSTVFPLSTLFIYLSFIWIFKKYRCLCIAHRYRQWLRLMSYVFTLQIWYGHLLLSSLKRAKGILLRRIHQGQCLISKISHVVLKKENIPQGSKLIGKTLEIWKTVLNGS